MKTLILAAVVCLTFWGAPVDAQEPAPPSASGARPSSNGVRNIDIERLPNGDIRLGKITLLKEQRALAFPAKINRTFGPLEVLIATPIGRLHESLLSSEASPFHLQTMLHLLGLKNGPRLPDDDGRQGDLVDIDLEWTRDDGTAVRESVEDWLINTKTEKPMKRIGWVFVGSRIDQGTFLAELDGNLVLVYSVGETVLDIPSKAGRDDTVFVVNEEKEGLNRGSAVRVVITPRKEGSSE